MILVTGDTHANIDRFAKDNFPLGKTLTKNDYVIIAGDFGLVWDQEESECEKWWLDWLDNKPWTTLFVDGNHENFDRLESYPKEEWCGGLVQKIRPSVMHLCRGEIFNIEGKTILALGGAASHDIQHGIIDPADYKTKEDMKYACVQLERKHGGWQHALYRIKGQSWWPQEVPSSAERENAKINLAKHNNKVDYVISHEAPASDFKLLGFYYEPAHEYSIWLEGIRSAIDYKHWTFGHYHINKLINSNEECVYENIYELI